MTPIAHTPFQFLAATFLLLTFAPTAFAGAPIKWKSDGSFLEVYGSDGACVSTYLHVSKGGTAAAPQTRLFYNVYDNCASVSIASGEGLIANTAFKVSTKGATLAVTPRAGAAFNVWGQMGSINLTATANGLYTSSSSGHYEYSYPGLVFRSHGSWASASATVTGSIVSQSTDGYSASVGTSRERSMEMERLK